jgi:hypothetical protein
MCEDYEDLERDVFRDVGLSFDNEKPGRLVVSGCVEDRSFDFSEVVEVSFLDFRAGTDIDGALYARRLRELKDQLVSAVGLVDAELGKKFSR